MRTEWITIGVVTAPHGVRGQLRVFPTTDFPDRFASLKRIHLFDGARRRAYRVQEVGRLSRGMMILTLNDISGRDEADRLRDQEVQVPREEAAPLPPGHFYVFDLVGCRVTTIDGDELGQVHQVLATGANDVYIVRDGSGREVLIPALKHVVVDIDVAAQHIVVDPPAGLLDL